MMRICQGLGGFTGRASFRTWLTKVVDNQCWTFLARRRRYPTVEHSEDLIALHEGICAGLSQDRSIAARIDSGRLLALSPRGAREIIWLRFFQGLSLDEIATTLEITLSAAKMRLYRALDGLARDSAKPGLRTVRRPP
jgi:RNA polymerase sigma-70 factor (ECF subfamily)